LEEGIVNRNSFALSQLESDQLPEHLTYAAQLRAAAAKAVSTEDVTTIVQNVVKRAKEGDEKAMRFLFDAVLGANQPVTLKQVNHYHEEKPGNGAGKKQNGKAIPMQTNGVKRIAHGKPAKSVPIGHNPSPLSNESKRESEDIAAYLRIHGPSHLVNVASDVGITPRRCRELATASSEVSVDGDELSLLKGN
jgi:hypothetical protein